MKERPFNKKLSRQLDITHTVIEQLARQEPSVRRDQILAWMRQRLSYLETQLWNTESPSTPSAYAEK